MHPALIQYIESKIKLDDHTRERVEACFKPLTFKNKEFILRVGETCRQNYFVVKGCLRFFTTNTEGQEFTRYFGFEGKLATALTSFIEQKPSFEYIQSIGKTEVLAIGRSDFYQLVDEVSAFNLIYRNILEMAYVTSQKRIYGLQGDTALERLKWLMEYQPKILSHLPSNLIASYLGVTPYTLSRLKSEL